jgi:hypothetical protein
VKRESFYEPLPIGSDAFMAPLAPRDEPRPSAIRKIAMWCALGALAGASAGGIALAFLLERESDPSSALGRIGVATQAPAPSARAESRPKPPLPVAAPAAEPELEAAAAGEPSQAVPSAPPEAPAEPAAAATPANDAPPPATPEVERKSSRRSERRSASLPDRPSRAQVLAAMARVQPAVKACLPTGHGHVTADMTVLGRTGRVSSAQISGQVGRPGSCIARAVRKARFPKFAAESISIRYPMAH